MEKYKLFDAELKFMNIIWEEEPIKSGELVFAMKSLGGKNQLHILF